MVVIGVGVGTGVTAAGEVGELTAEAVVAGVGSGVLDGSDGAARNEGSGVLSGAESSGAVSWADRPPAAASSMEKIMARRIIDGLNTKR